MSSRSEDVAAPTRVLVDANVLFSRTLRDWLFLLRNETGGAVFTVAATEDIIAETVYRYRRRHPRASGAQITSIHDRITEQLDERITHYTIDGSSPFDDENDGHVHAAAVAAGIDIVVTADKGFTRLGDDALARLPYQAVSADGFLTWLDDECPEAVDAVMDQQIAYWAKNGGGHALDEALTSADCPVFAARVRR